MLLLAAQEQEGQEEPAYFEQTTRAIELVTVWDFRYIQADSTASWLDAELGKTRYGGDGVDGRALFRIPQASIAFDTRPTENLVTHVQLNLDLEPAHPGGRYGWDRIRLVEAFADWRWSFAPPLELRVKGGLFFPPISLENVGEAWSTFYTVTPSAINAWVGEEVRSTGLELALAHVGAENELSLKGAVFWNNDPTGSLLAYRGFALHDRQTGYRDRLPLPDIPSLEPGGAFEQQAPWVEPLFEIDDRPGYYGALAWEHYRFFQLNGLYFDNRGIPNRFDGKQYAWKTRFANVGAVVFLRERWSYSPNTSTAIPIWVFVDRASSRLPHRFARGTFFSPHPLDANASPYATSHFVCATATSSAHRTRATKTETRGPSTT